MKRISFLTIALVLAIIGSSQAQKVTTDYDKSVDFSKFKSFEFLGWQNDSDQIINDIDKTRLRDAFKEEFDKRKLEPKESGGDMAITLFYVVDQKTSTTAYTNYYGNNYGGRYNRGGWGWGNGYSTTTYSENDYLEGTLVMDVYDNETGNLVWQGVSTKTVSDPKKREKTIPKGVKKLMKKFPIEPVE